MERYDYIAAVAADVKEWINDNVDLAEWKGREDELADWLNETLWTEDSVTGNASGSYTFSTWKAEENLCHNLDLLRDALKEFGCGLEYLEEGAEACDVAIRCYLLAGSVYKAVEDFTKI